MQEKSNGNNIMNNKKGFILLEILLAIAVIGAAFSLLLGIGTAAINFSGNARRAAEADFFIREELEAVRAFRDATSWGSGLGSVATGSNNPYYLFLNEDGPQSAWQLVSGTETINNFSRKVIFDKVSRSPSTGNIEEVYNIANDDPDTRMATVIVSSSVKSYEVSTYFTNWQND